MQESRTDGGKNRTSNLEMEKKNVIERGKESYDKMKGNARTGIATR